MSETEGRTEHGGPTEDRVLLVEVLEWYGRVTLRPLNETARRFADLLGQKTLTESDAEKIKGLGYIVRTEGKEL